MEITPQPGKPPMEPGELAARTEAVPRAFDGLSETGALGRPEIATADKGEALFEAAAEVTAFVREFAGWPEIRPR